MCDFFWLSPADQGDLSDVVRASLQQQPPPHHRLPPATATVCSHGSLGGSRHLPEEEEEPLLPLQAHGNGGMGFMVGRDHASLYPQLHQKAAPEGLLMIPQLISGRRPQLCASGGSSFAVEREDNAANAPVVLDELGQMDMAAMAPHHPPHAPSIKRRKSQTKKVVCIPAPVAAPAVAGGGRASTSGGEVVPSDLWAWRKYGQKPIKGSPYPRGYYRCSSSKGCSARKQVERSRTDPSMLVITYTSDHNHPWPTHRNALAGSTRPPPAAASSSYSSSAAAKSHHHQQQHRRHASALAAAVSDPAPPHHRRADDVAVADNNAIHHHQLLLKQEVLDMDNCLIKPAQDDAAAADDGHDLLGGMIADVDGALNALCATTFHSKKQQQHATADHWEKLPEDEEDKQQLLLLDRGDPFSFSFLDWVGASFGVGEATANKGGYS